jgi:hypothetical protein
VWPVELGREETRSRLEDLIEPFPVRNGLAC